MVKQQQCNVTQLKITKYTLKESHGIFQWNNSVHQPSGLAIVAWDLLLGQLTKIAACLSAVITFIYNNTVLIHI